MMKDLDNIELVPGKSQCFVSATNISLHQVIEKVLGISGKAEVLICSFSIAEDSLRVLHRLKQNGKISRLTLLFDKSVRRHKMDLLGFCHSFADDIYLNESHIKLVLINNQFFNISIITSANLTNNERYEYYIISNVDEIIEATITAISSLLQLSKKHKLDGAGETEVN